MFLVGNKKFYVVYQEFSHPANCSCKNHSLPIPNNMHCQFHEKNLKPKLTNYTNYFFPPPYPQSPITLMRKSLYVQDLHWTSYEKINFENALPPRVTRGLLGRVSPGTPTSDPFRWDSRGGCIAVVWGQKGNSGYLVYYVHCECVRR